MSELKLGDMVNYTHKPKRIKKGSDRTWRKVESEGTAMYIGYRYISDGVFLCAGSDDDYFEFIKENTIKVWLVVENERQNPFYVYPMNTKE